MGAAAVAEADGADPRPPLVCASVACGTRATIALGDDGRVYTFGLRCLGRPLDDDDAVARSMATPAPVAAHDAVWVGAGDEYAAALDDEGVLWVWGEGPVVARCPGASTPVAYALLEESHRVTSCAALRTSLVVTTAPWACAAAIVSGAHTLPPAAFMTALREEEMPQE